MRMWSRQNFLPMENKRPASGNVEFREPFPVSGEWSLEEIRMHRKAIVFDMDGVLFDTERLLQDSWITVARKHGLSGMEEIFPRCIGLNANDSRQLVMAAYGPDFDYQGFRGEASEHFWKYIEEKGLPIKSGVEELLQWLEHEGWSVGLASSTRRESVMEHLKRAGIGHYFSVVVTGDMVEHSKPRPDIYLLACEMLGADPRKTFAEEDSPNGVRSAHAAGMSCLTVPDMIAPDREIKELSTEIFRDLTQVLAYLQGQQYA